MSNIVNLRQARKQNKRKQKDKKSEKNRIEFGRNKQDKNITTFEQQKSDREFDGKKIEDLIRQIPAVYNQIVGFYLKDKNKKEWYDDAPLLIGNSTVSYTHLTLPTIYSV